MGVILIRAKTISTGPLPKILLPLYGTEKIKSGIFQTTFNSKLI